MIIMKGLSRYPKLENKFKEYGLGWTTKRGGLFYPTLVWEFYINYHAQLENMCKPCDKVADHPLLVRVWVRGVSIDISTRAINRFLHGPDFMPRDTTLSFYAQIKNKDKPLAWLANIITDGEPS